MNYRILLLAAGLGAVPAWAGFLENHWAVFGTGATPVQGDTGPVSSGPLTSTHSTSGACGGGTASSTLTTTTNYGSMSVSGSGSAVGGDNCRFPAGAFVGSDVTDPNTGYPLVAEYEDTLTVTFPAGGLPPGGHVVLSFTEGFSETGSFNDPTDGSAYVYDRVRADAESYGQFPLGNPGPIGNVFDFTLFDTTTRTETWQFSVGDAILIHGYLYASGFSGEGGPFDNFNFSFSAIDPLTVSVLTPGASYVSDSGTVYNGLAAAAPEPASFLLIGAGLAALGFRLVRSRKDRTNRLES